MRRIILFSLSLFLLFISVAKAGMIDDIFNPQDEVLGVSTSSGKDVRAFYFDSTTNDWQAGTDVVLGGPSTSNATDVRLFCYDDGDWTSCTDPADMFTSNWGFEENFGAPSLTPTSTIPVWFKDAVYASSTLQVVGDVLFESDLTVLGTLTATWLKVNQNQISNIVWGDENNNASSTWALLGNGDLGLSSTSTSDIMTWANDGNVGIGTASPAVKLEVLANGTEFRISDSDTSRALGEIGSTIQFWSNENSMPGGENNTIAIKSVVENASGNALGMAFWTTDGAADAERVRIDFAGNVGIGNTAPGSELEVSDSASATVLEVSTWSTDVGQESQIALQKSASATINTLTTTAAGEDLGLIFAKGVDTNSASKNAARILFEGDAAPDADAVPGRMLFSTSDAVSVKESFRVDDSQNVLIANGNGLVVGAQAQQSTGGQTAELQVLGTAAADASISIAQWVNGITGAPAIRFYKSRDGTIGGNTAVTSGDVLGYVTAYGDDGTDDDTQSSNITFDTEGTIGTGRVPGVITFSTLQDTGSPTLTEAMRIDSSQRVGIGTTTPETELSVHGDITGNVYYSEMWAYNNATTTPIAVQSTYYKVGLDNDMEIFSGLLNGMTHENGTTTMEHAGIYRVIATISGTGSNNKEYHYAIGLNNVRQTKCHAPRKLAAADIGSWSVSCLLNLSAGDDITLMVENTTDTADPTVSDFNLNIEYIGLPL